MALAVVVQVAEDAGDFLAIIWGEVVLIDGLVGFNDGEDDGGELDGVAEGGFDFIETVGEGGFVFGEVLAGVGFCSFGDDFEALFWGGW